MKPTAKKAIKELTSCTMVAGAIMSAIFLVGLASCTKKVDAAQAVRTSYYAETSEVHGSREGVEVRVVDLPTGDHCVIANNSYHGVGIACQFKK
jgi:hypothetical protein